MGVVDTIIRSKDDGVKPDKRSYGGYGLEVRLVDIDTITGKKKLLPTEMRARKHELSGKEPIREVIVLDNSKKSLGRFTTNQIKDMFDDMGFNVDTIISEAHFSDIEAVMNINGYSIPGWVKIARIITHFVPSHKKLLLTKLAPGRDRLHIRIFENNDGSWIIAAHTDHNWLSLNLVKVKRAHVGYGAGDYVSGTRIMYDLLRRFKKCVDENKVLTAHEIQIVTKNAYYKTLVDKLRPIPRFSMLV